jgi:adenine phosphoribosyltransferase
MSDYPAGRSVSALMDSYPDHPTPGILFRDLTPVFADADAFRAVVDELGSEVEASRIDVIAGVEARGFLLAAAVGYATRRGVLAVRKAGKLPGTVLSEEYDLEYGSACLELHPHRLAEGTRVLLVDDLLATGGTLAAAASLVERSGYVVGGVSVVLELGGLGGRARLGSHDVRSILSV